MDSFTADLKKIEAAILAELDRLQEDKAERDRMEQITWAILNYKPAPSARDAAACRATEIRHVSNGRPQFYIPDLGE